MPTDNLFADFPKISVKEWKQKIQFDLNGEDYNDSLVWESPDGIKVKPFYHLDDYRGQVLTSTLERRSWQVGQSVYVSDAVLANKKARGFLKKGVESLFFIVPTEKVDLEVLFNTIPVDRIYVHLELMFLSPDYIKAIAEFFKATPANIYLHIDPIGNLARTGNWFFNRTKDYQVLDAITDINIDRLFSVDLSLYQNAGATLVQQLAYAIAHANEYLNHSQALADAKPKLEKFTFKVSIGPNYFFEISKIKALRILWKTLTLEYGFEGNCHIIAQPSKRNKTLYEYNANMIRTTMECMAAILGGADTIFNLPYDSVYHKDNTFGNRIALNQLLLLKEESYFNDLDNATDGTYFIETITTQLAEKALQLFKTIEKDGGFLNQLRSHTIQKKIKESAQKEQNSFDNRKLILIGTNRYENTGTKMKDEIENYPFVKTKIRKTLVEPIIEKRLSEALEKKRLTKE